MDDEKPTREEIEAACRDIRFENDLKEMDSVCGSFRIRCLRYKSKKQYHAALRPDPEIDLQSIDRRKLTDNELPIDYFKYIKEW